MRARYVRNYRVVMGIIRPYSVHLARGTLLMLHSPAVSGRYAHMRRGIITESVCMAATGFIVMLTGFRADLPAAVPAGLMIMVMAAVTLCVRSLRLRYRRSHTPGMIFVAKDGLGAIMPDTSSVLFRWGVLKGREIRLGGGAEEGTSAGDGGKEHAIMLKANGTRLYLTRDLDGYDRLRDILRDLKVPFTFCRRPSVRTESRALAHRTGITWSGLAN